MSTPVLQVPVATASDCPPHAPVLRLPVNARGRDFVVGDVHGHFELLRALLDKIEFDPAKDRLLCTGDLVDRGPYSSEVTQWLGQPWLFSVLGNHEQMVLDYFAGTGDVPRHCRNGGHWFYQLSGVEQQAIHEAIRGMPVALEVARPGGVRIGVIHAELPCWEDGMGWERAVRLLETPADPLHARALKQAIYARDRINGAHRTPVPDIEALYVGHSTVANVTRLGNVVYVDTGCSFADGHLSAIELGTQAIHESRS